MTGLSVSIFSGWLAASRRSRFGSWGVFKIVFNNIVTILKIAIKYKAFVNEFSELFLVVYP